MPTSTPPPEVSACKINLRKGRGKRGKKLQIDSIIYNLLYKISIYIFIPKDEGGVLTTASSEVPFLIITFNASTTFESASTVSTDDMSYKIINNINNHKKINYS